MSCDDTSRETRSSLVVRIRGDSRDPGSTRCAFADLIQDFQTTLSGGGLVRPSTTAKTRSISCACTLAIGVPHLEDESASVTPPSGLGEARCRDIRTTKNPPQPRWQLNFLGSPRTLLSRFYV